MEKVIGEVVYTDYPDKYAKKVDWWKSDAGLDLIKGWRAKGKTIKQVLDMMGIDPRTFRSWRKKYPEFNKAIEVGQEVAISRVEHSLFKKACGYEYTEQVYELVEGEMILVREFHKHMPPDVKAIMHWLYNRNPQAWRNIQEPLENTQYAETIKNVLVAMKEVAENQKPQEVEVSSEVVSE